MKIVLLTPARRFIANRWGLGYQVPLGLVLIGGPLVDDGHRVRLVDNDVHGWDDARLIRELAPDLPDSILLGHTGSTAAHPAAMRTAAALRTAFPRARLVYGGVFPSYAAETVLRENPALDVVVRGEGEATAVDLARVAVGDDLSGVRGISWREGAEIRENPARPPIADLDQFRPGWELVQWDAYRLFGAGRSAGMQFSRGCPLRCTFCGQWSFWRKWRHRSPANFVGELELLARRFGVRFVWLADENFAADRELTRDVLGRLAARDLGLSLNLNMTAADVVRDQDLLPLYKRAGVDNVVLGIETLDDPTIEKIGKNNPRGVSRAACRLLRQNQIVSFVNVIYGLQDETPATLRETFRGLLEIDPDIVNACYLTPHSWTPAGRRTRPDQIVQPDLERFTYRNPVVHTPGLSTRELFLGVKLTEALFHLRPRGVARLWTSRDRFRRIFRSFMGSGFRVFLAEIGEFLFGTEWVSPGTLERIPGYPVTNPRPPSLIFGDKNEQVHRSTR
ncbi:MAG TPA: radical SAM protein [Planctomycetota bacterium]|nr:radical SAM protein [Planctomycetota bacterium]